MLASLIAILPVLASAMPAGSTPDMTAPADIRIKLDVGQGASIDDVIGWYYPSNEVVSAKTLTASQLSDKSVRCLNKSGKTDLDPLRQVGRLNDLAFTDVHWSVKNGTDTLDFVCDLARNDPAKPLKETRQLATATFPIWQDKNWWRGLTGEFKDIDPREGRDATGVHLFCARKLPDYPETVNPCKKSKTSS